jgi:glycosyltransferase involved in cell wall biosynthesis
MFAGGGITHTSGGVGTLIRYLMDEWAVRPDAPQVRVIDTRGNGGNGCMGLYFLKAVGLLFALGATGRLGIMHIHMNANGSAVRKSMLSLLGNLFGAPVILHLHGADFREFYFSLPAAGRRAIRFVLNSARYVIVLGGGWREFLVANIGVEPYKIVVVPNGVPRPTDLGKTASGKTGLTGREAVRIAFLGRLGTRKGVPELLAAFQSPKLLMRSWTATIAGDGPVEEFRAAVAKADLADRVTLPGWVDRDTTHALLRQSDIFVLPSHQEVMPIAILEALAHGVAVVTTPVGAVPEFLTDGQTALLVSPGAPDELANALARLIDDAEERCRLGAAGHQLFLDSLDISVIADCLLELYESARQPASTVRNSGSRTARLGDLV